MLESFIDYIAIEKRYSEHTCLAYKKDIEQFLEFADCSSSKDLKEIDSRLVRGWIVDLMENDNSARTVNRKLSSLRTYFKWLLKEGEIDTSPMATLQGPKNEKRLPHFAQKNDLEPEKINELFDDGFEGIRDRLMLEFFYQTGIRLSELINLKDSDISEQRIKVLGKRNKERIIPITPYLNELIRTYKSERDSLGNKVINFFVLKNGNKLYPKFVYRKINRYLGEATNLEKKSPHVLRHTFATHMLNNGAGLEVLKELLGHANLSATQVYTHNSFAELTKIYSQSHPRGRKN
jgi:integrase/recombinase XerC